LENKIGAGLIEEVIQVAEGELKLVGVMVKSKVYVSLSVFLSVPANYASQMGRSRGKASGRTVDIFYARYWNTSYAATTSKIDVTSGQVVYTIADL
jgi:hypothetical protein